MCERSSDWITQIKLHQPNSSGNGGVWVAVRVSGWIGATNSDRVRTRGVPSAATLASCSQRAWGARPSRSRAPRNRERQAASGCLHDTPQRCRLCQAASLLGVSFARHRGRQESSSTFSFFSKLYIPLSRGC